MPPRKASSQKSKKTKSAKKDDAETTARVRRSGEVACANEAAFDDGLSHQGRRRQSQRPTLMQIPVHLAVQAVRAASANGQRRRRMVESPKGDDDRGMPRRVGPHRALRTRERSRAWRRPRSRRQPRTGSRRSRTARARCWQQAQVRRRWYMKTAATSVVHFFCGT